MIEPIKEVISIVDRLIGMKIIEEFVSESSVIEESVSESSVIVELRKMIDLRKKRLISIEKEKTIASFNNLSKLNDLFEEHDEILRQLIDLKHKLRWEFLKVGYNPTIF